MEPLPFRVGLQQRVLPVYRAPLFEALGAACPQGLGVFAGRPGSHEAIESAATLQNAQLTLSQNVNLFGGRLPPLWLVWQPQLLEWLRAWDPRALIVEANPRNRSLSTAAAWMHSHHRAMIGWGLGAPEITGPLATWQRQARKAFLTHFDALIAYSRRGANEYLRIGFSPEQVFVAPNAATPRPQQPPPMRGEEPAGGLTVLFVGRLQARKRLDNLLRACAALPPSLQPCLLIVGDGPERSNLERLAQEIYPQAEFTGARRGADLDGFIRRADLFVLPGTGGLAVQQAMASALPVVVAEADGTQEDLVRPENGWRIPPGDLPALTQALAEALSDRPRLRRMGLVSYRIVSEEVNLEAMVDVFVRALWSVCSR